MDNFNQVDKSIYNEKTLNLLNIKELRSLRRKLGVPAPASKKKKELVDYILKIVYGDASAQRSPFGRPTTNEFDMGKCLEKIKKNIDVFDEIKTASLTTNVYDDYDYGLLKVASPVKSYNTENNIIETYIFSENNGKYFLKVRTFVDSKEDIEISKAVKEKYNLVNYDVVEIIRKEELYKIYSINGIKVKNKVGKIYIDNVELKWGNHQDFCLSTKEEINTNIEKLINDCEKENIKLIIFSENKFKNTNCEVINYTRNEENAQIYKKLMMLLDFCEKAVFNSDDFIIVIDEFNYINNILMGFEFDIYDRIKKYFQDTFKKIVDLGNICLSFNLENNLKY